MRDAIVRYSLIVVAFASLPGCAPTGLLADVRWTIHRHHVLDAKSQTVSGMPYLRVNSLLLHEMTAIVSEPDVEYARGRLRRIMGECHDVALASLCNEIDRLPPSALEILWRRHFAEDTRTADLRADVRERVGRAAKTAFVRFRRDVNRLATVEDIRGFVDTIRRRVDPSPKSRHGHGPLLAFVSAMVDEPRGPMDKGADSIDVYLPPTTFVGGQATDAAAGHGQEEQLLARFAPIIAQERVPQARYPRRTDVIGTIRLDGTTRHAKVIVDTATPSVYAYWRHTLVGGVRHLQLVYTFWFPGHPPLKFLDAEAGRIDGATLRITLDPAGRPALFETVLNCGCHHRFFPTRSVELAACRQYGPPMQGKASCIERALDQRLDSIVPETVRVPLTRKAIRPILFCRAGYHALAAVTLDQREIDRRSVWHRRAYALRPYDALERLPVRDGYASMFNDHGLVRGAGRLEGWLLAATGMLSAGQPRQRGTQRVVWDQYDFDDPQLLETCLRLPAGFWGESLKRPTLAHTPERPIIGAKP